MHKTLIVVMGGNRINLSAAILPLIDNPHSYHITTSLESDIINTLRWYDQQPDYNDIVFVTSDVESSEWFVNNKYDEKVLLCGLYNNNPFRNPSITWNNLSEIPSLIKRLEGNISEHANF